MRRSGLTRDGRGDCYLLGLAVLFLVRTVCAQCNPASLQHVHANFDVADLACESSGFHAEAWSRHNNLTNTLDIAFIAQLHTKSWAGLGFAANPVMENASAVLAIMGSADAASVSDWYLVREGRIVNHTRSQLRFSTKPVIQYIGGIAYVSFALNLDTTTVTPDFLLFAHGPLDSSGHPQKHVNKVVVIAKFAQGPDPEGYKISTDNLRKAHAAVNILGWGVLLPTGAIIARYCRQWDPAWFYLHITFQILGFIFILAGLITGSKMYGRLKGLPKLSSHRALGIFLFTLACLQILAVLWRPKKEAKIRRYWNWYHSWVGRLALFLAAINVLVGIHVAHEKRSVTAGYVVIAAIEIIAFLVMESLYWIKQRKDVKSLSYATTI
ncbi:hypothetical protein CY35_14G080400 [Sphagnum magellanicum]|nr:hypothetical protein CY35_14G080400 [Sphagnum magellanicum]